MATTYSAQAEADKKKYDQIYDSQKEQIIKNYDAGIDELNTAYDDEQRTIAVQKLINERKVAESMANLGLTDSGLNRTQQTAVQLSAANAGYNLNRQKQAAIDKYNLERDNSIAEVEQSRLSTHLSIDDKYQQMEENAKAAEAEALEEASWVIGKNSVTLNRGYTGTLSDNGVQVTYEKDEYGDPVKTVYTDYKSGQTRTFDYHTNPYTNTTNPDTAYGCFKNGYQPNNINNIKLKKYDTFNNTVTGLEQNVFEYVRYDKGDEEYGTLNSFYFIWDGSINEYVQVVKVWDGNKATYRSTGKTATDLRKAKML